MVKKPYDKKTLSMFKELKVKTTPRDAKVEKTGKA